jgi:hypothetical protein
LICHVKGRITQPAGVSEQDSDEIRRKKPGIFGIMFLVFLVL